MKKSWIVSALLVFGGVAAGAYWWQEREASTAVQYRSAKLERGPLQATVSASGAVNPVTQVSVGTQVSGQIRDLYVDFNAEVKAGQLIARIDPETFEYRVRSAQADVDAARAAVMTAQANSAASRAQVSRANVDLDEAKRDFERKQSLVEKQFIAQTEADKARALVNTSTELLKSAQAQLGVTEAQIKTAQANVAQRESALAQARIDLERTRITSPVNGIVIKRAIEKGQTVAASLQAPELFVIAQNLQDMQVEASIDEADIGRIRTGQKASFTVDAFAGQTFDGQVRQVRKAAQSIANVVTYVAVVGFANTDGRLLPGMTANVRIITEQRDNVLKVPNAALRVRIAGLEVPPAAAPASASDSQDASKTIAARASGAGAGSQNDSQNAAAAAASGPGGSGGGGNPAAEFRQRLLAEVRLSPAQLQQVDAMYLEVRPKMAALRELPTEQRSKARERLTADLRARIGDVLSAEQKPRYAALLQQLASRQSTRGRIYLLGADGKPRAVAARLGISDGSFTELQVAANAPEAALLKEGTAVIVGVLGATATAAQSGRNAGPRAPF